MASANGGDPDSKSMPAAAEEEESALQIIGLKGDSFEVIGKNLDLILGSKEVRNLPAVIVSVAGPFRLGKSFLLNYFVRYLEMEKVDAEGEWIDQSYSPEHYNGFKWSHGAERHTTGVWMYRKPFIRKLSDGRKVAVLLVDTQGTFDNRTRNDMNAIIFAMNSLISSIQVYNVSKRIGEDVLQNMHCFTRFGQMAFKEQSSSGQNDRIKPFQRLHFLIRDWEGKRDFPFGDAGGEGYLKTVLDSQEGEPTLQEVRRDIKDCFGEIDCFLMPHPGAEVAEGDSGDVEGRFKENLEDFVPRVLRSTELEVKSVLGQEVKCRELKTFINQYTELFKGGTMPEITGLFQATAKLNHENLRLESVAKYKMAMRSFCGTDQPYRDPEELEEKHTANYNAAVEEYQKAPRLDAPQIEQEALRKMEEEIKDLYAEMCATNEYKNLSKNLTIPVTFISLAFVCFMLSSFFSFIYLTPLEFLFSRIMWFCFTAIGVWAAAGKFRQLEGAVKILDEIAKFICNSLASSALPFNVFQQFMASEASTKKKQ